MKHLTHRMMPVLMAVLALATFSPPAQAIQVPDNAVSQETAVMIWLDISEIDAEMFGNVTEMFVSALGSELLEDQAVGLPVGDIGDADDIAVALQRFQDAFVEAGGQGLLLMLGVPDEETWSPPFSVLVKVGEDADSAALAQAMSQCSQEMPMVLSAYAEGWFAVEMDVAESVTTDGDESNAAIFNGHLAEAEDATFTAIYRMEGMGRAMLSKLTEQAGDSPEMAMLSGVLQPLMGLESAAISLGSDDQQSVSLDMALTFEDGELAGEFGNIYNGLMLMMPALIGMQTAQMENAPDPKQIAEVCSQLMVQTDGQSLRLHLDQAFFDAAEELGSMVEELMGETQGEGEAF